MNTPHKRWVTVVALTCCLAVFLSHFEGASARVAPEFPGKDASMDELVQFYNEVQQYLNSANRLSIRVHLCPDLVSDPAVRDGVEIQTLVWTATHEKDISSMDKSKEAMKKQPP
ncbi:hypothetical protein JD844_001869 [Phrynosoma platyrhinos]|uniref:Uncharacterized protein n=1 Tax=Phrynosoma platyrhinos TaxID=52577 RepID=A0ABQ7TAI3_PHRPL|nr:hypothetical protein JD844_001869 [Phrynosoma platyrhinos]